MRTTYADANLAVLRLCIVADALSCFLPQCLELYAPSLSWSSVESCSQGELGKQLMHANGKMTRALNPRHTYVPWVTINGVQHLIALGLDSHRQICSIDEEVEFIKGQFTSKSKTCIFCLKFKLGVYAFIL